MSFACSTGCTGAQVYSTMGAVSEIGEPNHAGIQGGTSIWDVWGLGNLSARYVTAKVKTFDSQYPNPTLNVYVGPGTDYASLVAIAPTSYGSNGEASITFYAEPGDDHIYYIVTDNAAGEQSAPKNGIELSFDTTLQPCAAPTGSNNGYGQLAMATTTSGATIIYRTVTYESNSSSSSSGSTAITSAWTTYTTPLSLASNTYVEMVAFKQGMAFSSVSTCYSP